MQSAVLSSGAFLGIVLLLTVFSKAGSNPLPNQDLEKTEKEQEKQDALEDDEIITQLENYLKASKTYISGLFDDSEEDLFSQNETPGFSKRALDFGLNRGFSGSQAAKHVMGLSAANFAGGPGRKRRNWTYLSKKLPQASQSP